MKQLIVVIACAMTCMAGAAFAIEKNDDGAMVVTQTMPRVDVIGTHDELKQQPGTAHVIDKDELESTHVHDVNEALRKVPGVNVRDEEGFGMRPNIGIRGLNPTRSTKVLLLEDGIPAAYAPYGDNASYYHAPVERYDFIEVLKGVGLLRFGPQTIGGAINYITPVPRLTTGGYGALALGNRDYVNGHFQISGENHLVDIIHKESDGSRDNMHLQQTDMNYKTVINLNNDHALTLRANYLNENSQITYTGITDAELANFGADYNPFENDRFFIDRFGASATHAWQFNEEISFLTNVYGSIFERDWWRQASTTTDNQCGFNAARAAGIAVNPDACNSIQGRLREYHTWGVEPRMIIANGLGEFEAGVRWHDESQNRVQRNKTSPDYDASSYTVVEKNDRTTHAQAAFVQNRFELGRLAITPALRHEQIDYTRYNELTGARGDSEISEWIPGVGFTYVFSDEATLYGGIHRGFAPPRAEDIINNAGGSVEVNAEKSVNSEIGIRADVIEGIEVNSAWFRANFSNQVAVGSIAGGSTPLAEGEALYEGLELSASIEASPWMDVVGQPYARVAYTWLAEAEQKSVFRCVDPTCNAGTGVVAGSGDGLRMPYAPEHTATVRVGYRHEGWDGSVEAVYVDEQYADFANTKNPVAGGNGQIGELEDYTAYNLVLNYSMGHHQPSFFVAVKNLENKEYIVDRTRGIQMSNPRLLQAGFKLPF